MSRAAQHAWILACLILAPSGCRGGAGSHDGSPSGAAPAGDADPLGVPASVERGGLAGDPAADPFAGVESLRPRAWAGWPLENVDLEGYDGWRIDPVHGAFVLEHGLVFVSEAGAFVLAIADAEVIDITKLEGSGEDQLLELHLDHGRGIESHVGPVSDALVHAGLPVTRGAAIGLAASGSLRLRVTVDGVDVDPLLILRQPMHRWPGQLRRLPPPSSSPPE
jgi:hypothetical protein